MRATVQRVLRASVRRAPESSSSATSPDASENADEANRIGDGLLVLLGIHRDDRDADLEWMVQKLLNLKIFNDADDARWKLTVKDLNLEILCISQFTLYGNTNKGNKPDFHHSMLGPQSQPIYEKFLKRLGEVYQPSKIQRGFFGQRMLIDSQMDGPVTIILDSPMKGEKNSKAPMVKEKQSVGGDAKSKEKAPESKSAEEEVRTTSNEFIMV